MTRRKGISGETVSLKLPSGIPVEIQELSGNAERHIRNKQFVKSGKWIELLMMDSVVSLDGKPLPDSELESEKLLLDLRTGDRNYLLLRIRMQSFGESMAFNHSCPECKKTAGYRVDFQDLLDSGELKIYPYREDVPIELEIRGGVAVIDYADGHRERLCAAQKEIDPVVLSMMYCKTLNGEKPTYEAFAKLFSRDLAKIRETFLSLRGGLNPEIELECLECGYSFPVNLAGIQDFFFPSMTRRANIGP
ncbi:MAG: hypothetical protein LBR71_01560 [Synergistaceae bacterium]|jgi:hypothetical protein|nr:hypothetical protein [Synergistaceae bacterium]